MPLRSLFAHFLRLSDHMTLVPDFFTGTSSKESRNSLISEFAVVIIGMPRCAHAPVLCNCRFFLGPPAKQASSAHNRKSLPGIASALCGQGAEDAFGTLVALPATFLPLGSTRESGDEKRAKKTACRNGIRRSSSRTYEIRVREMNWSTTTVSRTLYGPVVLWLGNHRSKTVLPKFR